MDIVSKLYDLLRRYNDYNAVKQGKIKGRVVRKVSGRAHGGILQDLLSR